MDGTANQGGGIGHDGWPQTVRTWRRHGLPFRRRAPSLNRAPIMHCPTSNGEAGREARGVGDVDLAYLTWDTTSQCAQQSWLLVRMRDAGRMDGRAGRSGRKTTGQVEWVQVTHETTGNSLSGTAA